MHVLDVIDARRDEIRALAKRYRAERLWVFGSCARREERPTSDIDFLAAFASGVTIADYTGLKRALEKLLPAKVDLVSDRCMTDAPNDTFSANVLCDRILV